MKGRWPAGDGRARGSVCLVTESQRRASGMAVLLQQLACVFSFGTLQTPQVPQKSRGRGGAAWQLMNGSFQAAAPFPGKRSEPFPPVGPACG